MLNEYLFTFFISMVPLIKLRVGILILGTGAWTGTLEASILDIDFKII